MGKDKREVGEESVPVPDPDPDPDPHIEIEGVEDPDIDYIVMVVVVFGVEEVLLVGDPVLVPVLVPVRTCLVVEEMDDYRFAVISAVTTNDILVEDKNL